ncbi:MAG: CpsB/CapC family capsule biosynthesis tyrosine phosphatase, partial [Nitrospirota bacterium]
MIDLHCHVLPGIDDGPRDFEGAVRILRLAAEAGIKGVAATPHVVPGHYDNTAEKVLSLVAELKDRAGDIPVQVYPGSEIAICEKTLKGIVGRKYCTINSTRYILLELPPYFRPEDVLGFLESLSGAGLVPIIAHPERNPQLQSDVEFIYKMV